MLEALVHLLSIKNPVNSLPHQISVYDEYKYIYYLVFCCALMFLAEAAFLGEMSLTNNTVF